MKTTVLAIVAGLLILSTPTAMAQDFCKGDFNYNGSVASDGIGLALAEKECERTLILFICIVEILLELIRCQKQYLT